MRVGPPKQNPLAFISHGSADKERIARPLDVLLRDRGIRVWLDERDLLPGYNLVDSIFDHGIAQSDAFVAILSCNSINSAWVHEELTNAIVQRIQGNVKIVIPVVLDGVAPPEFLTHIVWERVANVDNLMPHADRIAAAIIGHIPAPTAPMPEYAGIAVHGLHGLSPNDERIFAAACRQVIGRDPYHPVVDFSQLFAYGEAIDLNQRQVAESLAALEQYGYFRDVVRGLGEPYPAGGYISDYGLEQYLVNSMPRGYRTAKRHVLSAIINDRLYSSMAISASRSLAPAIVEHILHNLEAGGYVIASHHMQGIDVNPNATLPRLLRELEGEA